jgi:hypothetical protein
MVLLFKIKVGQFNTSQLFFIAIIKKTFSNYYKFESIKMAGVAFIANASIFE